MRVACLKKAAIIRHESNHVADFYLQRNSRRLRRHDDLRAVALALGAAVAGAGNLRDG